MRRSEQVHLPKEIKERNILIADIEKELKEIQAIEGREKDREILKLRAKLIGDCDELSVVRIDHLEQIFKHYCTHIFKIGKHMTFQRLEYEKIHLTLDRLCVFLKDFGLTSANIDGHHQEVLDKQEIVRYFKRHSKNCKDLSFEEFVSCIEKLSIIYYDEKENFKQKKLKQIQQRDRRIAEYKKRLKKKGKQMQKQKQEKDQSKGGEVRKSQEDQIDKKEESISKGQNDDLVKNMMENDNIDDPHQQLKPQIRGQNLSKDKKLKQSKLNKNAYEQNQSTGQTRPLYQLTVQEKIEYYYQLFGVDNVQDFRKRMSELNLPLFRQEKPKKSASTKQSNEINVIIEEQQNDKEEKRRLIELREKLNMKKQRDKSLHSPKMSKQQYEERKRRRQEKQTEIIRDIAASRTASRVATNISKKKVDLTEKEVSLNMLNHISFDDLKHKFNPAKYFSVDDSDPIFMHEYGPEISKAARKPAHSNFKAKDKTDSTFDYKKRNSSNVVDDFKKRAYQMQAKQFHKEAAMSRAANKLNRKQL